MINRKQVVNEQVWNLEDIFESDESWRESYLHLDNAIDELLKKSIDISTSTKALDYLNQYDEILGVLDRVTNYAKYKFSEDESDPCRQKMNGKALYLANKASQLKTKFVNAWLQLDDDTIQTFKQNKPELLEFNRFLDRISLTRKNSASIETEELLSSLQSPLSTPESFFHSVTSSDMTFDSVRDTNGKDVPVSLHMYMTQIETSPDTTLRRNAYKSLTSGLQKYKHGLAQSLNGEIHKNISIAKLRNYKSTVDMLLQHNSPSRDYYSTDGMDSSFFNDILDTFQQELSPHMQRYALLRKKVLGLDELRFSDVKAPLDTSFNPSITFQEAGEIITSAVGVLGEEYQNEMSRVFKERWVYTADNIGRRMIAFGGGVHGVHGYSFYPFGGSLFDLMLLGHELGHTIHHSLSNKNQRIINNDQSLTFVEAPSTLIEHLIVKYLQKHKSQDQKLQRWLNMYLMMSYHHNCVTHVLEAELLRRLYNYGEINEPLTTDVISSTKQEILSNFWGDTIKLDEGSSLTWMRQPHYYMGVYPFTYSVGMSASTIISNNIFENGLSVGKQWTEVLKMGGSINGFDLYKKAGVDMSTTKPLKTVIADIGKIVDDLESSFS